MNRIADIIVLNRFDESITVGCPICCECNTNDNNYCSVKEQLTKQADEWLQSHYPEKFSLNAVSCALAVHPNYLVRVYKEITGETLLNRHNRIRCEKACILLKETDSSISYIANQIGYQTSSHFTVVFKRILGCTPREYREKAI